MKWYYIDNNETKGPFSLEEILPNIEPHSQVWREESLSEWVEASKHPLLQILFNSSNHNSNEEVYSDHIKAKESNFESECNTAYEITLILNTDWKTKRKVFAKNGLVNPSS
jgi:hypothetical protein